MKTKEEKEQESFELEIRKVKALEKIGNSLDALTVWFEEIDKDEWSNRIQWYLAEYHTKFVVEKVEVEEEEVLPTVKRSRK